MGKSGGRKKKSGASQNQVTSGDSNPAPVVNGGVNLDSSVFLKKAHELKEEGNRRFQAKDYVGALQQYENALKLTPKTHPDRAVFHSNRAACLMQMKPIDYETVISECNLALQVQPRFVRALLRRARAFEAIGKYEMAMQDVQSLLIADPNHGDALEIAGRLRMALGPRQEAQQDLQSRPSPAALGASAVRGAPIAGLGPCLPARPVPKKHVSSPTVPSNKSEKLYPIPPIENGPETRNQLPKVVLKPSNGSSRPNVNASKDNLKEQLTPPSIQQVTVKYRPLKLVYDHDIRLAQMPVNCSFKVLRDVVSKRFPMSKAVLIKYKDCDGDLVTITCSAELRLAESSVDNFIPKDPDTEKGEDSIGMLRLHIVEVSPEQEPPLLEEEEEKPLESEAAKGDENVSQSSVDAVDSEIDNTEKIAQKEKTEDGECKEVEMDDWLFEFAQLFRTHVGIDPDAHIDLHEVGMELCSEALEETVTSEEAQSLFDKAALKFQEVAALAFFNWGNVHIGSFKWDPTETIGLFDSAEEKMRAATEMWEKLEEQRAKELKDPSATKKDEMSKRKKNRVIRVFKNHCSNEEAADVREKKVEDLNTNVADEKDN
ncbi:hypothetical protein DH2020_008865 [Rehmannia glutinosa]|uniref:PB1 domain-containing protein n=1 Tax=Rehmannia glutinosa TaxID=99300 RepID=A0ABR0X7M3_REHGL